MEPVALSGVVQSSVISYQSYSHTMARSDMSKRVMHTSVYAAVYRLWTFSLSLSLSLISLLNLTAVAIETNVTD